MMRRLMQLATSSKAKKAAGVFIILLTLFLFGRYISGHRDVITTVKNLSPIYLLIIMLAYSVVIITNASILFWSVKICGKVIGKLESSLLTGYSTLINFFGPLQSGPGFRAVYLKKKLGVSVKSFGIASLLYYGAYGVFSLLMLGLGLNAWLSTSLLVILLGGSLVGAWIIKKRHPKLMDQHFNIIQIIIMTAVQVACTSLIYFLELRTVNAGITIKQAVIYTGAANLALFVSLTPGAIGFREAFLVFSIKLHHIDKHTVLTASIIDRAVFFIFLAIVFLATTSLHAKDRFAKAN